MLSEEDKQYLLKLARITLEKKESDLSHIPQNVQEKGATFINIYKDNQLIHSVGTLTPSREVFQDVMAHIFSLNLENTENLKIEISLLKNFQKLRFESQEELFSQITPYTHGIAIEKDKKIATLLPNIWSQIQDKGEFLNQICTKLQLEKDSWKTNANIFIYETETFREN